MNHTAGDNFAYAERLLDRLCVKWAFPRAELYRNRHSGRRYGSNIVRAAIMAEFVAAVRIWICRKGQSVAHTGLLSHKAIGELLGICGREVRRHIAVVEEYERARQLSATAHCQHNVSGDRAPGDYVLASAIVLATAHLVAVLLRIQHENERDRRIRREQAEREQEFADSLRHAGVAVIGNPQQKRGGN